MITLSTHVTTDVLALKGAGFELLLDSVSGTIVARFYDGVIVTPSRLAELQRLGDALKDECTIVLDVA
jgi:hypothetical protein